MLKATEPVSWQQQLDRINFSKPQERAAAIQELQSFQQDALNCITYRKGFEIECGYTTPTAVAWWTQAAVKATPMEGTYTMTYTDCLKKIIKKQQKRQQ